jgi:hypothetical protein
VLRLRIIQVAKDLEGADGIAKGARYLTGGQALDKESAKGLIDTLLGGARLEEEAAAITYVFRYSNRHVSTVLHAKF